MFTQPYWQNRMIIIDNLVHFENSCSEPFKKAYITENEGLTDPKLFEIGTAH